MTRALLLTLTLTMALPCAAADVALDPALIATLPTVKAGGTVHGKAIECEGVSLTSFLQAAKAMPTEPLRGAQLSRVVEVTARDGYRVAFSMAELDPTLGNARVFVVDACDGKPLDEHDGPLRLLVPGDARPARGIRQLQSIVVADAP